MNENNETAEDKAFNHKERRWSKRNSTSITAHICFKDGKSKECLITSISMNGMYLVTTIDNSDQSPHLTIDFPIEDNGLFKHFYETVHIVHVDKDGIAVAFDRYDSSHFATLQRLFHMVYQRNPESNPQAHSQAGIQVDAVSH